MISRDAKLLRHRDAIDGIVTGQFKPPVMVDVDPVDGACNLDCAWCCQAASRLSYDKAKFMSVATMVRLGHFSREWGIKAWRISSDSEPTLNKELDILILSGHDNGIDMGLITNGVLLERVKFLKHLKWLGISLDAATAATWANLKRSSPSNFDKIIDNVKRVRQQCPELDISLKFLAWKADKSLAKHEFALGQLPTIDQPQGVQTTNEHETFLLEELARDLGVNSIVKDAYPKDFASQYRFTKCRATPLGGVFGADHKFHLCCDARSVYVLTDDYTRNDWRELPLLWGGEKHQRLIATITPASCAGCAKHQQNELLEHVVGTTDQTDEYQVNFI